MDTNIPGILCRFEQEGSSGVWTGATRYAPQPSVMSTSFAYSSTLEDGLLHDSMGNPGVACPHQANQSSHFYQHPQQYRQPQQLLQRQLLPQGSQQYWDSQSQASHFTDPYCTELLPPNNLPIETHTAATLFTGNMAARHHELQSHRHMTAAMPGQLAPLQQAAYAHLPQQTADMTRHQPRVLTTQMILLCCFGRIVARNYLA